jgi:hypothetical protein
MEQIRDISDKFPNSLKAEQKGKNVLILWELKKPRTALDGTLCEYQVEYRWLKGIAHICSVQGQDFSLWQKSELNLNKSLFEQVNLF